MKYRLNFLLALRGGGYGFSHLAQLNLRHHAQHVFLALKIVEKGSFAHVCCFSDLFHRNGGKSAFGKQVQRAAKEPQPGFGGAALTPSGARGICLANGSECMDERDISRIVKVAHIRMMVNNDHRSLIV